MSRDAYKMKEEEKLREMNTYEVNVEDKQIKANKRGKVLGSLLVLVSLVMVAIGIRTLTGHIDVMRTISGLDHGYQTICTIDGINGSLLSVKDLNNIEREIGVRDVSKYTVGGTIDLLLDSNENTVGVKSEVTDDIRLTFVGFGISVLSLGGVIIGCLSMREEKEEYLDEEEDFSDDFGDEE